MKILGRLELAFEHVIERSMAGVFRLRVQPAEIGRRLERAMLDGCAISVGTTLAPNLFEVRLHPEDAASFADWDGALSREMEDWLAEIAFARGLAMVGPIRVTIAEDPVVPRRSVRATGRFGGSPTVEIDAAEQGRLLRLVPVRPESRGVNLSSNAVTVGRASDNALVIADLSVSRLHARIEPRNGVWTVIDLESRNGTRLNGRPIRQEALRAGDELAFGGVLFTVAAR